MKDLKDTIDNGESEVQVTTIGTVVGTGADGEPVEQNLTENALIALAEKHKDDEILVDADHESETSSKTEAKGWLSGLKYVPGKGLFGRIKWTDLGRKLVENRVFRWLSPSWYLNKDTKEPTQMTSVALTNKPSQAGRIEPIVNSAPVQLTDDNIINMEMTKEELIELIKQTIIDLKKEKKLEEIDDAIENENEVHEDIVDNLEQEKQAVEAGVIQNSEPAKTEDEEGDKTADENKTEETSAENACGDKTDEVKNEEVEETKEEIVEETKEETKDEDAKEPEETDDDKDEDDKEEEKKEEVIKIDALNSAPKTFGLDIVQNTGKEQPRYPGEGYAIVKKVC